MSALAVAISAILGVIAAFHLHWGFGGVRPARDGRSLAKLVVGATGVTSMPSPAACIAVALMLVIVALWPLLYMRLLPTAWPNWLLSAIGGAFALVFLLRGAAGYTTPWRRRFSEEPFASLDRAAYSPLCMLLAASMAALLLGGAR